MFMESVLLSTRSELGAVGLSLVRHTSIDSRQTRPLSVASREPVREITVSASWSDAISALIAATGESGRPPLRVALCGAKGVGKSTLARFIANALLTKVRRVVFVETDCGQCEFTPSGIGLSGESEPAAAWSAIRAHDVA